MTPKPLNIKVIVTTILVIVFGFIIYNKLIRNDKHIIGNYYFDNEFGFYIKTAKNSSGHGRIWDFDEIGWNDKFIVTRKHNLEKGIQEYSLIEISRDNFYLNSNEIVIGPITQKELEKSNILDYGTIYTAWLLILVIIFLIKKGYKFFIKKDLKGWSELLISFPIFLLLLSINEYSSHYGGTVTYTKFGIK